MKELEQFQIKNVVFKNRNTDNSTLSNQPTSKYEKFNMSVQLPPNELTRYERRTDKSIGTNRADTCRIDRSI